MMLKRIAAAAVCSLLLAFPSSAQVIGSGHVIGNGTSSPAAPTDTPLIQIMNRSGSGLGTGVATALGLSANSTGGVPTLGSSPVNGDCASFNTPGQLVPIVCPGSPALSPINFGAVGDGVTDDTVAWQNMCAAVRAAGTGWISSPLGKNYLVLSGTQFWSQARVCDLDFVNGVKVDMNGSKFTVGQTQQFSVFGSPTAGDVLRVQIYSVYGPEFSGAISPPFTLQTVSYTVAAGNSTTQMAAGLVAAINANSTLAANSITATNNANVVSFGGNGTTQIQWYTILVPPTSSTESMLKTIDYVFLLNNSQNVAINDLQGSALSGYADSVRGGGPYWVNCANEGGAFPLFGCRNLTVTRANLTGGLAGVAIVRAAGTGDWSYGIHVDGIFANMGYPFSNQWDGLSSDFNITTINAGRSYVGYNVHGVHGTVVSTHSQYAAPLYDLDVSVFGFGSSGVGTDISSNETSGMRIDYINKGSTVYGASFSGLTHQQGDSAHPNLPSRMSDINFNYDVQINNDPITSVLWMQSFTGAGGSEVPGDTGNTERSINLSGNISGLVQTSAAGSVFCLMSSASVSSCAGWSGLSSGNFHLKDLNVEDAGMHVGVGAVTILDNFISANWAGLVVDTGFNGANLTYRVPVELGGAFFNSINCAGSPTASFSIVQSAVTHC